MRTEKITVRLPLQQIHAIDTFVKLGEFVSRSEAIRRAIQMLLKELTLNIEEKKEMWKKIQELQAFAGETEKYNEK
ncbi:MAG: ribbon-helix-helix protein, CopG family [Thermoplasmata archaeon]|nr:MAG: ribbon-helix-helix protein, CopG family [Thermoplasmata archaeon]KAA0012271.1 MAG: ribbon-helix-helix protein, CopG family [Thermoplasmata archaeon]